MSIPHLQRKYRSSITVLIALLFHGLLLLILWLLPVYEQLTTQAYKDTQQTIDIVFEPPQQKPRAKLVQGPSTFGENEEQPQLADTPQPANPAEHHEQTTSPQEQPCPAPKIQEALPPQEQPRITPERPDSHSDDICPDTTTTVLPQKSSPELATPQKKIAAKPAIAPLPPSMRAQQALKQPRSIIQLTQGYLDSIDMGGHDHFNRDGDPSIRPDFADMKWMSYERKIFWEINRSLRMLGVLTSPIWQGCSCVMFTIQPNGTLNSVRIFAQGGSGPCDQLARNIIKSAGPLPPIPQHLERSSLEVLVRFRKEGMHFIAEMKITNK